MKVKVIGAGLAGCEAAWQIANAGIKVELIDMKPSKKSAAHHSDKFAELVCSNSLKAARLDSAAGLLKEEMRYLGSLCLEAASKCSVAAGGALAVDREIFSAAVIHYYSDFAAVSGIYRAGGIGQHDVMFQRQTAAGTYLRFKSRRQFHHKSRRYKHTSARR